jgi:hypothetical protein
MRAVAQPVDQLNRIFVMLLPKSVERFTIKKPNNFFQDLVVLPIM